MEWDSKMKKMKNREMFLVFYINSYVHLIFIKKFIQGDSSFCIFSVFADQNIGINYGNYLHE